MKELQANEGSRFQSTTSPCKSHIFHPNFGLALKLATRIDMSFCFGVTENWKMFGCVLFLFIILLMGGLLSKVWCKKPCLADLRWSCRFMTYLQIWLWSRFRLTAIIESSSLRILAWDERTVVVLLWAIVLFWLNAFVELSVRVSRLSWLFYIYCVLEKYLFWARSLHTSIYLLASFL